MRLKQANHAGEHGVYGSLEVLGDVQSKNIRQIKRTVDMIQYESTREQQRVTDYWSKLSDDGKITPIEKKIIKKEWEAIAQSYAALLQQATELGITGDDYWLDYAGAYSDLRTYLFTTISLFDDMEATTQLDDRDTFNSYFSGYYYAEKFIQMGITSGVIGTLDLDILHSLDEEGVEGEIKVYRGQFYQYVNGVWVKLGSEGYLGILNSYSEFATPPSEGQYFLAGEDFEILEQFGVNDEALFINDEPIYVRGTQVHKGEIWVYTEDPILLVNDEEFYVNGLLFGVHNSVKGWDKVTAENWRYITVMQDYMVLYNELPSKVREIIEDLIPPTPPQAGELYLGILSVVPQNASEGQYFVYGGTDNAVDETHWFKSSIYKFNGTSWEWLDPELYQNQDYYMRCLKDILSLNKTTNGYFAAIFANAFFTNSASINALKTKTIYLDMDGCIQSELEQYIPNTKGLKIDASGNIDANKNTHIGGDCLIDGKCNIKGDVTLGNSVTFKGLLSGAAGSLDNITIGKNSTLKGDIINDVFEATNQTVRQDFYYAAGTRFTAGNHIRMSDVIGTYLGINFTEIYINADTRESSIVLKDNGNFVYTNYKSESSITLEGNLSFYTRPIEKTFNLKSIPRVADENIQYLPVGTVFTRTYGEHYTQLCIKL